MGGVGLPVIDARFQVRVVQEFLRGLLPPWASLGACAGQPTDDYFKDDVTDLGVATEFPETVYDAMRVCAGCSLRRECVTWAYETEQVPYDPWSEHTANPARYGVFGGVPGPIRERFAADPDRVDRALEWYAKLASSNERRWVTPRREQEETA